MSDGRSKAGWKAWWARSGESVLGTLGAFTVTYAIAFALTMGLEWMAQRFVSVDGGVGLGWKAMCALLLTLVFYWYDRNSMS
ncbi:MAG: hypothetical protein FGM37_05205 [Phycisphaerales bacterium]|nr:hypothetical protein [Phycisphaerales bacterium]